MLKIGEFSKLSMLTIKALRFYEEEGILIPRKIDDFTGYRYYDTKQLVTASKIKSLRQLDFSIEEIKLYLSGKMQRDLLVNKEKELETKNLFIKQKIFTIHYLLEENKMNYQVVVKEIPACIVYSEQRVLKNFGELTNLILESAKECLRLNPGLKCVTPDYCFCEYLDGEYRETNITTRYCQAVIKKGIENDRIKFIELPKTKVLSIYHKGSYDSLGDAYSFIFNFAHKNSYKINGTPRESYIDGVWNKENVNDWLTEIQIPIE